MSVLMSFFYVVNSVGMILGPILGAFLESALNYEWVFNCNSILVLTMVPLIQVCYPYDPPAIDTQSKNKKPGSTSDDQ